ncbi:MAG TPA: methyltransferase [Candidatus Limnocylindrales bacterium]|nr:methyltransferase [Candidatus Limnocylindrales bacterium]
MSSPPPVAILQMLTGRWVCNAVCAAARFRLADHLSARARTCADLAPEIGAHVPSLYRLLRALASLGLFTEDARGRFSTTPLGEYLRSDVLGSMYGMARFIGSEEHGAAWNALPYAVASGEPAFEHVYGRTAWQYLDEDPELNAIFSLAMRSLASNAAPEIAAQIDLRGTATVCDVGGADGTLLAALLERNPGARGILYDRAAAIAEARRADLAALRGRCDLVEGDFLERVPPADVIVLSRVLHDWADADAERILANCRAALPQHGRVVVYDAVIEPGDEPDFGKLLDLEMLVITPGGRERTRDELERLFAAAGLRLTECVRLPTGALAWGVPAQEARLP